jgi:hypothetical protein
MSNRSSFDDDEPIERLLRARSAQRVEEVCSELDAIAAVAAGVATAAEAEIAEAHLATCALCAESLRVLDLQEKSEVRSGLEPSAGSLSPGSILRRWNEGRRSRPNRSEPPRTAARWAARWADRLLRPTAVALVCLVLFVLLRDRRNVVSAPEGQPAEPSSTAFASMDQKREMRGPGSGSLYSQMAGAPVWRDGESPADAAPVLPALGKPIAQSPPVWLVPTSPRPRRAREEAPTSPRPKPAVEAEPRHSNVSPGAESPGPPGRNEGSLRIASKPWTRIAIDGKATGLTTPLTHLRLGTGAHTVTLSNPQFGISNTFGIEIRAGETTTVVKDLRPRSDSEIDPN